MNTSPRSITRIVNRHLSRQGLIPITRGESVYLCEQSINSKRQADLTYKVTDSRMLCTIVEGDNVFALRHILAVRESKKRHELFQSALEAPRSSRQYNADQASQEFQELYRDMH